MGWHKRRTRERRGTYLLHLNHSTVVIIWRCEVRGEVCVCVFVPQSTMIHGSTKRGVMGGCLRLDPDSTTAKEPRDTGWLAEWMDDSVPTVSPVERDPNKNAPGDSGRQAKTGWLAGCHLG